MEVSRLFEGADRFDRLGVLRVEGEGVGEVDFGDADAGFLKGEEGFGAVLELEGEVAGVVVQADVFFKGLEV